MVVTCWWCWTSVIITFVNISDCVNTNDIGDRGNNSYVHYFWLQIQRSQFRFPALPDFLSNSGSGTGSTQPREVN